MEGRGWGIDSYLKHSFDLPAKNPSEDSQRKWRSAVGKIVKNRRRRFRMVPDLDKRSEEEAKKRKIQVNSSKKLLVLTVNSRCFTFALRKYIFASPRGKCPASCSKRTSIVPPRSTSLQGTKLPRSFMPRTISHCCLSRKR